MSGGDWVLLVAVVLLCSIAAGCVVDDRPVRLICDVDQLEPPGYGLRVINCREEE